MKTMFGWASAGWCEAGAAEGDGDFGADFADEDPLQDAISSRAARPATTSGERPRVDAQRMPQV
jgi:hypothetical protein